MAPRVARDTEKTLNSGGKNIPPSLEELGIRIENGFAADEFPRDLRDVFQLVHDTKSLRVGHFAGYSTSGQQNSKFMTRAAHQYDKLLKEQAKELAGICADPTREDSNENKWVSVMEPIVFYRFDHEKEEIGRHHCFVCRRDYQKHSRPLINRSSDRGRRNKKIYEVCTVSDKHFNLPNFATASQLAYYNDDDIGAKPGQGVEIPDLTIGLHTYTIGSLPWQGRQDLVTNDRVRLFDRNLLGDVLRNGKIEVPYRRHAKRATDNFPAFTFGLWEAKKATAESHQTALIQSGPKIKTLLRWQRTFYKKAVIDGSPLLWWFGSVGSNWKIYGCHTEEHSLTGEGCSYVLRSLWSGDSSDADAALQLLYIVDIIAIWAEHTYKPVIATCISRLQNFMHNEPPLPLDESMWAARIAINRVNFPWLFNPDWRTSLVSQPTAGTLKAPTSPLSSNPRRLSAPTPLEVSASEPSEQPQTPPPIRRLSTQTPLASPDSHLRRGTHLRNLDRRLSGQTCVQKSDPRLCKQIMPPSLSPLHRKSHLARHAEQDYIIPELHDYVWLLDRDPGGEDLLVIRVDEEGNILQPLILFDSTEWDFPEFTKILRHEWERRHPKITVRFTVDDMNQHYLHPRLFRDSNYSRTPLVQFCAILPLDHHSYKRQRTRVREENELFETLESAMGISKLLAVGDAAYKRWCVCGARYNEYSPPMILCDNTECVVGWYHHKCVGLDDWFETDDLWFCDNCPPHRRQCATDSDVEYDEAVFEASSYRVHRTKTFASVWAKHSWPSRYELRCLFDTVSSNLDIVANSRYKIPRGGKEILAAPPNRSWVLRKDKPNKLIVVRPCQGTFIEDEDTEIEELDGAFESISLGRNQRHCRLD